VEAVEPVVEEAAKRVQSVPGPPQELNVAAVSENGINLHWKAPGNDGGAPIKVKYAVFTATVSSNTARSARDIAAQRQQQTRSHR